MISTYVARINAGLLLLGGLALLFASDTLLPSLIPTYPAGAAWLGQLLGASWLGFAAFNWLNRSLLLGGIYARPVVMANAMFYLIAFTVLVKPATRPEVPQVVWFLVVPIGLFAGYYGWLLVRGPLEHDFEIYRRAQAGA